MQKNFGGGVLWSRLLQWHVGRCFRFRSARSCVSSSGIVVQSDALSSASPSLTKAEARQGLGRLFGGWASLSVERGMSGDDDGSALGVDVREKRLGMQQYGGTYMQADAVFQASLPL
eukprot:1160237-Pelagomonas_calceolata.AAC.8